MTRSGWRVLAVAFAVVVSGASCSSGNGGAGVGDGSTNTSCSGEQTSCGGSCSNLLTDDQNCGACFNPCAAGQTCDCGTCSFKAATAPCPGGKNGGDGGKGKDAEGFVSHDAGTDCGGRTGNACGDGAKCMVGTDCQSGLCKGGVCVAPPATCSDGKKDGQETDVDCGGPVCAPCGTGKDCDVATDCVSDVCAGGTCQAASDTDGVKNDSETDVDCGGALQSSGSKNPSSDGAPACVPGKVCLIPTDCVSDVCSGRPVVFTDGGVPDAGAAEGGIAEAGVDATDVFTSPDGGPATLYCQLPSPTDGVQNDAETDVDCGGGFLSPGVVNPASDGAPPCALGQKCLLGTDCTEGVCNDNNGMGGPPVDCPAGSMCTCQPPSNTDTVKNDSETDVDCGGGTALGSDGAPPCAPGLMCLVGGDCQSFICGTNGLCTAPSPTDGVKNDSETDVDCGGGASPMSDGAPACADAKGCILDTDCLSSFCSLISNVCVDGQSCKGLVTPAQIMDPTGTMNADGTVTYAVDANGDAIGVPDPNGAGQNAGIDTCGIGESTDPIANQTHESCCKSLLLPGSTTFRMDKYVVTSGRIRQFLQSLNYDVRDWAIAQFDANLNPITQAGTMMASQIPVNVAGTTNALTFLPHSNDVTEPLNAVVETGVVVLDTSGVQGCFTGNGEDGASTYWWDGTVMKDFYDATTNTGSQPRPFTQDYYDIKPMNCIPYFLAVAFCAWDGGRLLTQPEHASVWGSQAYPWGPALIPVPYPGNQQIRNDAACTGGMTSATAGVTCTIDWFNGGQAAGSQGDFYYYPSDIFNVPNVYIPDTLTGGLDLSPYIAAPGRFYLDRSTITSASFGDGEGWQDIGALMLLAVPGNPPLSGSGQFCDESGVLGPGESYNCGTNGVLRGSGLPATSLLGGSWEGHGPVETYGINDWSVYRQYGKTSLRCVRPAEPAP